MTRAVHFPDIPPRMNELWEWVSAFYAFDYGDTYPLEVLVRYAKEIPPEMAGALADVVAGRRKPNMKAARKIKIPAREAMLFAGTLSTIDGIADAIRHDALYANQDGKGLVAAGAYHGKEPAEIGDDLAARRARTIRQAADHFDVSTETVENLLREMRRRIDRWPEV